jgi:WD40 repeat protein
MTTWDLATGKAVASTTHRIPTHHLMALSSDFATLAVPNFQDIDLWDVATGRQRTTLSEHRGEVHLLEYSADGLTLVVADQHHGRDLNWKGEVKLWDAVTGKERGTLKGPFGYVRSIALSPDSKLLALLDTSEMYAEVELKVIDIATSRRQQIPPVPGHSFTSVAFTADGRLFVIGTPDDKTLSLWQVKLPQELSP